MIAQITAGVFEYRRIPSAEAGVVLEDTLQDVPQHSILEATFQLGNSTSTIQRVTILIRTRDFADLQVCSFWLEPGAPLETYVIRTYNITPWTNSGGNDRSVGISFYAATTASSGWIRLDNVTLRIRPSLSIIGTECYTPGTAPGSIMLPSADDLNINVIQPQPLTVTPEPSATPFVGGESGLAVTATPAPEIDTGEGGLSEGG